MSSPSSFVDKASIRIASRIWELENKRHQVLSAKSDLVTRNCPNPELTVLRVVWLSLPFRAGGNKEEEQGGRPGSRLASLVEVYLPEYGTLS